MTASGDDEGNRVLELITRSMRERGYPPSRREITEWLGHSSPSYGQNVIDSMERKGLIEVDRGVIRGIRVKAVAEVETM